MSWFEIDGHDEIVSRFQCAIAHGRLASTFLFLGPAGIGKRLFAERLAMTLLCEKSDPALMTPCGHCPSCRQILERSHPDLIFVSKPDDRAFISIDAFIGPKEARRQLGLCAELAKKPIYGKRKIAIIDDADFLNQEGANAMLKTLEEPPKNSILILIGTSAARQLPTIRSRCQIVRFTPLETQTVEKILHKKRDEQIAQAASVSEALASRKKNIKKNIKKDSNDILSETLIPQIAACAEGSVQQALALAEEGFWEFRTRFLRLLSAGIHEHQPLLSEIEAQLESTGKVAALRRIRLRVILETAADFFRRLAFRLSGTAPWSETPEAEWQPILEAASEIWPFDAEAAANAALRSADWLELLQRNVHQPTLLDAWIDELIRIFGGDSTALTIAPWALVPNP